MKYFIIYISMIFMFINGQAQPIDCDTFVVSQNFDLSEQLSKTDSTYYQAYGDLTQIVLSNFDEGSKIFVNDSLVSVNRLSLISIPHVIMMNLKINGDSFLIKIDNGDIMYEMQVEKRRHIYIEYIERCNINFGYRNKFVWYY